MREDICSPLGARTARLAGLVGGNVFSGDSDVAHCCHIKHWQWCANNNCCSYFSCVLPAGKPYIPKFTGLTKGSHKHVLSSWSVSRDVFGSPGSSHGKLPPVLSHPEGPTGQRQWLLI